MSEPLIDARNLKLRVPVFRPDDRQLMGNPKRFLSDLYFSRTRRGVVTLLDDISLRLLPGERLGIIGANGAGKSTLLRLLAGIYKPTEGQLILNGKPKGLFDISLGMNQEATGLENVYIRGLQMGLKLSQIKQMVPAILDFSELADAIEQPLNTYSSGMRVRLAVAVSTMIEPEILLLDEWIGAGDAYFKEKVEARMDSLIEKSRGLIIATHNTSLMDGLCTHGLVLQKGKVLYSGKLQDALKFYDEHRKTLRLRRKAARIKRIDWNESLV